MLLQLTSVAQVHDTSGRIHLRAGPRIAVRASDIRMVSEGWYDGTHIELDNNQTLSVIETYDAVLAAYLALESSNKQEV